MELVYLWVEDYKNIHKQGFNFSPRFRCEYNDEKNELTIDENDDYIENFFGENINVTAIVGKNGSGKSSLLECLSDNPKFVVTFGNDEFIINKNINIKNKTKYILNFKSDFFKEELLFNVEILDLEDRPREYPLYIYNRQVVMFFKSQHLLKRLIFPKNIFYGIDNLQNIYDDYTHPLFEYKKLKKNSLSEIIYICMIYEFFLYNKGLENKFQLFLEKNNNILSGKQLFFNLKKECQLLEDIEDYEYLKEYCILFEKYTNIYNIKKDFIDVRQDSSVGVTGDLLYSLPFEDDENLEKILDNIKYYHEHFLRWNIKLSAGELSLINILSEIFDSINNSNKIKYLYLDECESFLHPNWQKKYISYIIQFIKDNFPNRKIHIILTSHSPFLLSDIPKQNIIFLDKDENGNCKVVNGLKEKKQTFGANIHTLLSDSFFMEDGLMGEFAKGKIDEVIRLLNKDKLDKKELKYCEQIISIIGEPIIKNQLQRMLDSKRLKKVDEIDAIKKSMEAMQKRLDELEK